MDDRLIEVLMKLIGGISRCDKPRASRQTKGENPMKDTKIYKAIMRLKKDLAPMTWRQRIDHIWSNYKETILIVIVVAITLGLIISNMLKDRHEMLLGGLTANVTLSDAGMEYVESAYFEKLGGNKATERVVLASTSFTSFTDELNFEANYYALTRTIAMLSDSEIDYLLMDKVALEAYLSQGVFLDLREFFSEDELEQMDEKLIKLMTVQDESSEVVEEAYPVAVNISDMPFIRDCVGTGKTVYFGIAANAPNLDTLRDFWTYLNDWEAGKD